MTSNERTQAARELDELADYFEANGSKTYAAALRHGAAYLRAEKEAKAEDEVEVPEGPERPKRRRPPVG